MSRGNYDYIISVGIDKEQMIKDFVNSMKSAKKQIDAENDKIIKWQVEADKESFMKSLTDLLSQKPDMATSILIEPDTSSFKKGLDEIDRYAKKQASQISKDFADTFNKNNVLDLKEILGGGYVTPNKLKEKITQNVNLIRKSLNAEENSLDVTKLVNYEDLSNVTNAAKELFSILTQLPTSKNAKLLNKAEVAEVTRLIDLVKNGYGEVFKANSEGFKQQLQSSKTNIENQYETIQKTLLYLIKNMANIGEQGGEEFLNSFKDVVNKGVSGIGDAISSEISQGVEQGTKSLGELEQELNRLKEIEASIGTGAGNQEKEEKYYNAVDIIDKRLEAGEKLNNEEINQYVESVRDYLTTLSKNSKAYEEVVKEYNEYSNALTPDNIFLPAISSMETYEDTLQRVHNKQQTIIGQISELRKGQTSEGVDTKLNVENEEALKAINQVKEALEQLPRTKTIDILFNGLQSGELQKAMLGWSEADNKLADLDVPLNERLALFNSKTGYISNSYIYDAQGEISEEIIKAAVESAKGQADSMIHTHGLYNVAALSPDDVSNAITALNDNITKQYVMGLNEVSVLDLSSVSKENMLKIEKEFNAKFEKIQAEALASLKGTDLEKALEAEKISRSDEFQNKIKTTLTEIIQSIGLNPNDIYKSMSISDFTNSIKSEQLPTFEIDLKAKISPDFSKGIQEELNNIEPKPTIQVTPKLVNTEELLNKINSDISNVKPQTIEIDKNALNESVEYIESLKSSIEEIGNLNETIDMIREMIAKVPQGGDITSLYNEFDNLNTFLDQTIEKYPELEKFKDTISSTESAKSFINSKEWNAFLSTLPKAETYLKSISYDLKNNNQIQFVTEEEIGNLNKLLEKIQNIKNIVNDKTQAFKDEEIAVKDVVTNELTSLDGLLEKINNIENAIKNLIEQLHDDKNTKVIFTPQLSKDFKNSIEDLIKETVFELNLTPVINNKPISLQENPNENNVVNTVDKQIETLTKEEKEFDKLINKARNVFLNGVQASRVAKAEIKEALIKMVTTNTIDSSKLLEILKNDTTYATSELGSQYGDILKYLRNTKIRYTDEYKSNFGDGWDDFDRLLGWGTLSKSKGLYPDELASVLTKQFPEIMSNLNNGKSDILKGIYDYLIETVESYKKRIETYWKTEGNQDKFVSEMDNKLSSITQHVVIPQKYLGAISANSLDELDSINAKYSEQLVRENEELEQIIGERQNLINNAQQIGSDVNTEESSKINNSNLTSVIDSLTRIEELLNTISSKDFFNNDSITSFINRLDEVFTKLENIIATEKDINIIDQTSNSSKSKNQKTETPKNDIISSANKSITALSQENKLFEKIVKSAKDASEAKKLFAENNGEVLKSIINSLTALNAEGDGFSNLNKIISNLANNKDDRITNLIKNLTSLRNVLTQKVDEDAFINAIKEIASQGDSLKDVAAVLKASKEDVEKAQKATGKTKNVIPKKDIKSTETDINSLKTRIEKLGNTDLLNELNGIKSAFDSIGDDADKLKAVKQSMEALTDKTKIAEEATKTQAKEAKELVDNYNKLAANTNKLKTLDSNSIKAKMLQEENEKLEKRNEEIKNNTYTEQQNLAIQEAKRNLDLALAGAEDKKTQAEVKSKQEAEKTAEAERKATIAHENRRNSLRAQASELLKNGKINATYGTQIRQMIQELSDTNIAENKLTEISNKLKEIKTQANLTGKSGKTLFQMLKGRMSGLVTYLGTFASFYRIVGYIRTAFTTIKELDTQLVDLRKTTTMTTTELNQFYNASSDIAKQLGVTTSEIISQAAAWSRLGYSSKEAATEMAQISSQFASISPGMTTDKATDYLVSTMQAYGIAVDDVERKVLDNVNKIGNTFATTNAEIGEMLTRSSAAMKAANNSLEETIALESAAKHDWLYVQQCA